MDTRNIAVRSTFGVTALVALLAFYAVVYSVHQDLAGSALSGRLAVDLGAAFDTYSLYFPPAEKAWFSFAAMISDATGLSVDLVTILMTGVATLISVELAYRVRVATVGATARFYILSLLVLLIMPILYKNVFGLREHLVALGLWPYLVLRVSTRNASDVSTGLRVAIGLWAGALLLFKYLYAIVVMLIEIADALTQKRPLHLFRVEPLAAALIVAVYLVLWLGLDPAARTSISAMSSAISANFKPPEVSFESAMFRIGIACALLVLLLLSKADARTQLIGFAVVVGAVVVAWFQSRWYSHHLFPITAAALFWYWLAVTNSRAVWLHPAFAVIILLPVWAQLQKTERYQFRTDLVTAALHENGHSLTDQRVGVLSQHPSPYNQVIARQGGARWTPFMNIAYVSSELAPFDTPENKDQPPPAISLTHPGREMIHDNLFSLLTDMPPDVLIVDRTHRWPLKYLTIDWYEVYANEPRFDALLRGYDLAFRLDDDHLKFDYYVRRD